MNTHKSVVLSCNDEAFDEIYKTKAIIKALITCCQDKEFKGEYYNLNKNLKYLLSEERNEYVSLLTIAFEKLHKLISINCRLEKEISMLNQNSDYCCREVATEGAAD